MSKKRCSWVNLENKLYVDYHDKEWGRPVHDDHKHFEMITLEGAQAGLSWETVLAKRDRYRELFCKFDPCKVAKFTETDVSRLLLDKGIIRHKLKIKSTISNAQAFLEMQKEFGSFDRYIWAYFSSGVVYRAGKPSKVAEELSKTISKDLKKRGFSFVGPTIVFSYLQAAGMLQDHSESCFLHRKKF